MEINRATGLEVNIRSDIKVLKKLILKLEAIEKVCRTQTEQKVKKEFAEYVDDLEIIHLNAKQLLSGEVFKGF